jgi:hypothetical protein
MVVVGGGGGGGGRDGLVFSGGHGGLRERVWSALDVEGRTR